jgi:hypothetical protein
MLLLISQVSSQPLLLSLKVSTATTKVRVVNLAFSNSTATPCRRIRRDHLPQYPNTEGPTRLVELHQNQATTPQIVVTRMQL